MGDVGGVQPFVAYRSGDRQHSRAEALGLTPRFGHYTDLTDAKGVES
jgi:hypothetical protein